MRVQEGPFRLDRVIEKLATSVATSDRVTLTVERLPEGKMRLTSNGWVHERVFAHDQVLEVRWVIGSLHVARKGRNHDKWNPTSPEKRDTRTNGTGRSSPMTPMAPDEMVEA
jgi:hypothetical protein